MRWTHRRVELGARPSRPRAGRGRAGRPCGTRRPGPGSGSPSRRAARSTSARAFAASASFGRVGLRRPARLGRGKELDELGQPGRVVGHGLESAFKVAMASSRCVLHQLDLGDLVIGVGELGLLLDRRGEQRDRLGSRAREAWLAVPGCSARARAWSRRASGWSLSTSRTSLAWRSASSASPSFRLVWPSRIRTSGCAGFRSSASA